MLFGGHLRVWLCQESMCCSLLVIFLFSSLPLLLLPLKAASEVLSCCCITYVQFLCASVGFLYPPGDYEQAIQSTHKLVSDPAFRKTMATAARAEVERFGWNAAITRVRNMQYQRAIRIYRAHKRYAEASIPLLCGCMLCACGALAIILLPFFVVVVPF